MRLDLVDLLRCPNGHDETPLVCVAGDARDRELRSAILGCPLCHAEFTVRDGVAWLGEGEPPAAGGEPSLVTGSSAVATTPSPGTPGDPFRLAAMLDLTSPGGTVVLAGEWAAAAGDLAALTSVGVVVLAGAAPAAAAGPVSVLAGTHGVPLARASLRGIALGAEPAGVLDARLAAAGAALVANGRLVAPVACDLPPGSEELARDARWWVAARREPPRAVSLRRAPPRTPGR